MPNPVIHADVRLGPQGWMVAPARIRKAPDFQPGGNLVAHLDDEQPIVEKAGAGERRLPAVFQRFEGRSLAGEPVAERREEMRRKPASP